MLNLLKILKDLLIGLSIIILVVVCLEFTFKKETKNISSSTIESSDITASEVELDCSCFGENKSLESKLKQALSKNKITFKNVEIKTQTKNEVIKQKKYKDIFGLSTDMKILSYARRLEIFNISSPFFLEINYNFDYKETKFLIKYETNILDN